MYKNLTRAGFEYGRRYAAMAEVLRWTTYGGL